MKYVIPTNTFITSKFIVSPNLGQGNYTSIQSAINDSSAGDTIFICDGTYNENITLTPGITLTSYTFSGKTKNVLLTGTLTYSGNGDVNISNIGFKSDNGYSINFTGSSAGNINLFQCCIYTSANISLYFTNSSRSSGLTLFDCICAFSSSASTFLLHSSPGTTSFINTFLANNVNNFNPILVQSGILLLLSSYVDQGFSIYNSGSLICYNSNITTLSTILNVADGTSAGFYNCDLTANTTISLNNAIYLNGSGLVAFQDTYFEDSSGLPTVGGSGGNVSILSIYPLAGTTLNFGSATVSYQNGKYGNINAHSLTSLTSLSTAPANSRNATLEIGVAYQNTLGYDILLTVYLTVASASSANILLGVGSTNTPAYQYLVQDFTITNTIIPIPIYLPANYYALLNTSGTIDVDISGQQAIPV